MRKHRRRRNSISTGLGISLGTVAILSVLGFVAWKHREKLAAAFNPANPSNVVNTAANKLLQSATGNPVDSIGTAIANLFKSEAEKKADAMLEQANAPRNVALSRTLKYGMVGDDVKLLQTYLGLTKKDGVFGDQTLAAVKAFQQSKGLQVDGIVGPVTWQALQGYVPVINQSGVLMSSEYRDMVR